MTENSEIVYKTLPEFNPTPAEETFIALLNEKLKVIYDWGYDNLWVVDGDDETIQDNQHSINGERFHEITGTESITSGTTVQFLLLRGVDVDVRNAGGTFKTEEELKKYMDELREWVAAQNQ